VRSLIIHPGSTTNSSQSEEQRLGAGIGPGLIRLSIGIEDHVDLVADLAQAFEVVGSGPAARAGQAS
jgi:O-acetylhomoserine (thiol)-lyase